jgi:hypothetical protein
MISRLVSFHTAEKSKPIQKYLIIKINNLNGFFICVDLQFDILGL